MGGLLRLKPKKNSDYRYVQDTFLLKIYIIFHF